MARLRNTPGFAGDAAMILLALLLGLGSVTYLVVHYRIVLPGQSQYHFAAEFDQAPAVQLAARQEVRIAGVTVGKITGASVAHDGYAEVDFEIDPSHRVYRNARVVLQSKTPLNIMYATLDPGSPAAGPLPEGGILPVSQTQRVTQPYELLDQLDDRARAALTSLVDETDVALAKAPVQLPRDLSAMRKAAISFQPVVDALAQRRTNLRHLVTSVAQIATAAGGDDQRLAKLATDLETTLSVVSHRDRELGATIEQLPGLTRTVRSSMHGAAKLARQLSPTLSSLTKAAGALPKTLSDLSSTVGDAQAVVTKAQPVVTKARPVVASLSPLTRDLHAALGSLSPVTSNLPSATAKLVPWLDDLGGFIYNTSSSFSLGDANGGLGRADLIVKLYDPTGGGQ